MKKYLTLILIVIHFMANAQCLPPTNLLLTTPFAASVQLDWTATGTSSSWEVAIIPNYVVGTSLPVSGDYVVPSPTALFTNLAPGCYVFCVRSVCALNVFSPWSALASFECSNNVIDYIATLSNENFVLDTAVYDKLITYPNPSQNILKLYSQSTFDKVIISDFLGKVILVQTQGTNEINVESLSKGIYIIEAISGKDTFFSKFIKE